MTVALASLASLAACGGTTSGSGSGSTITFALTPAATSVCVKVTSERGEFQKHGLTVTFVNAPPTSSAQIAQILNGQVTAGLGASTALISAVAQGLPLLITNGNDQDYDTGGQTAFAVMVAKGSGITSFRQLENKTVAVNSLKGSWEVSVRESVALDGGDPGKIRLLAVPFPDQAAALTSGRVDAVATLQPFIATLGQKGLVSIGDPQARALGRPDSVGSVTFMAKKYVEAHPGVVKQFVETMRTGAAWCNAHPDQMRMAIASLTKVPQGVIDQAPVPAYTTEVSPLDTERWTTLLDKYKVIQQQPTTAQVLWSGVPS